MDSSTFGRTDLTLTHVHEGKNYLCMRVLVLVLVCVCVCVCIVRYVQRASLLQGRRNN